MTMTTTTTMPTSVSEQAAAYAVGLQGGLLDKPLRPWRELPDRMVICGFPRFAPLALALACDRWARAHFDTELRAKWYRLFGATTKELEELRREYHAEAGGA